jgi:hypothetical protein
VADTSPVSAGDHDVVVSNRTRTRDGARRAWGRRLAEIGDELRAARIMNDATQRQVGAAARASASEVCRRELGRSPRITAEHLALHAAAVGLRLSVKLYPIGGGVRDEAQARYVAAFVARVGRAWRVTLEAAMPIAGDLRAVDVFVTAGDVRIAVEVITRLGDVQSQIRAAQLKARDIGASRLILVIADTHANASVVRLLQPTLVPAFDLDTRRVMRELSYGRDPGRDAIVMLRLRR